MKNSDLGLALDLYAALPCLESRRSSALPWILVLLESQVLRVFADMDWTTGQGQITLCLCSSKSSGCQRPGCHLCPVDVDVGVLGELRQTDQKIVERNEGSGSDCRGCERPAVDRQQQPCSTA